MFVSHFLIIKILMLLQPLHSYFYLHPPLHQPVGYPSAIDLYRLIFPLSTRLLLISPSTLILPPSLYLLLFLVQNLSSLLCPTISHPSFFFYLRQHHMHSSVFPHISLPPLFTRYLLLLYTTQQYNISPLSHTHSPSPIYPTSSSQSSPTI
jgi:hypothetical protein